MVEGKGKQGPGRGESAFREKKMNPKDIVRKALKTPIFLFQEGSNSREV